MRVLDDVTIQLTSTFAAATTDTSKNVTAISSTQLTLNDVSGIAVGTAVSYTAPVVMDFVGAAVNAPDVVIQTSPGPPAVTQHAPGAHNQGLDNIWVGSTVYSQLNTGDAVRWTVLSGDPSSNLASGGTYWVIKTGDGFTIKLAVDRCRAVGTCVDNNGTPDDPDDDFSIPQQAINLLMINDPIGNESEYRIERSIGGLVSGQTYYVSAVDVRTTSRSRASRSTAPTAPARTRSPSSRSTCRRRPCRRASRGRRPCSRTSPPRARRCGKLLAPSGQALSTVAPATGDGKSGATAQGGTGGGFQFAFPYAELKGTPSVSALVAAKTISAGGNFVLTATRPSSTPSAPTWPAAASSASARPRASWSSVIRRRPPPWPRAPR